MINRSVKVFFVVALIAAAFFFLFNYYLPAKISAKGPGISYWKARHKATNNSAQKKKKSSVESIAPKLGVRSPHLVTYEEFNPKNIRRQKKQIHKIFFVPEGIRTEVDFWKDVYTKHDKGKVVLHDKKYLDIIYSVLDVSDIVYSNRLPLDERIKRKKTKVNAEINRIASILKRLDDKDPATLTPEERKIYQLFENVHGGKKFETASKSDRLRSQTGIKEKFIKGIHSAGRYLGEMEKIFAQHKIPLEISRLAFVESMFNLEALSKVGASGIWQFMPSSGRLFQLKMDQIVDERNDPIAATHAAAKHLRRDYDRFHSWPLAINAYNTGPGRIRKAIARMNTKDIAKIIKNFDSPGYKFASRNFYPAFLAALESFENREKYFGNIEMEGPLTFDKIETPFFSSLPELSKYTGIEIEKLVLLNPHLQTEVVKGDLPIPQGFHLRVPKNQGENFLIAINEMDTLTKFAKWHIVKPGENLKAIATKYNTNIQQLKRSNSLHRGRVASGQIIKLPKGIALAKDDTLNSDN
jgi:membrane-bound lytic murein transglycosylase D